MFLILKLSVYFIELKTQKVLSKNLVYKKNQLLIHTPLIQFKVWSKTDLLQILIFLSSFLNIFCSCGVTKYLICFLFAYHNKSLIFVNN